MAFNPLVIIPTFLCIFPMNFAMATLGLKEMEKFLWEMAIAEFFWKMQRKPGIPFWGWTHASFPQKPVVKKHSLKKIIDTEFEIGETI